MPVIFSALQEKHRITRMKERSLQVSGRGITELMLPEINAKYIRKAGKRFAGMRVILPDDFEEIVLVRQAGMCPVDVSGLAPRIADTLCDGMMQKLGINSQNTAITISGKILSEQILFEMAKSKRSVILSCLNAQSFRKRLLSEYGIASSSDKDMASYDAHVMVNFSEKDFFLHIIKDGIAYKANMKIDLPMRFSQIPKTHIKGASVAFLQSGELKRSEMQISVECTAV